MLQQFNVVLPVYAESEQEAKTLEADFKEFVKLKYNQDIYVRAARLSRLLTTYGNNMLVNNALR